MEELKKVCTRCKEEKLLLEFNKNINTKDGLQFNCKQCKSDIRIIAKNKPKIIPNTGLKKCTICKTDKLLENFTKHPATSDGYYTICKTCSKDYSKEYYNKNKEKISEYGKIYYQQNKQSILEVNKKWKDNNREQYLQSLRNWNETNKEYVKEKQEIYKINNREKINERARNKKKTNKLHALKSTIRSSVSTSFKRACDGKYIKSKKTEEILDCNFEFFMSHIVNQFENWMTWENYGRCENNDYNCTWTFDHIIPLETAKTEEELILLNHWSNFQPLCSKRNMEKNKNIYPVTNLVLGITINKS